MKTFKIPLTLLSHNLLVNEFEFLKRLRKASWRTFTFVGWHCEAVIGGIPISRCRDKNGALRNLADSLEGIEVQAPYRLKELYKNDPYPVPLLSLFSERGG